MKFKHQNIIITVLLALLFLTACSKTVSNKTANLPTAKTILTKAEKDNFNSMHASWNESANQKRNKKLKHNTLKSQLSFMPMFLAILTTIKCGLKAKTITSK